MASREPIRVEKLARDRAALILELVHDCPDMLTVHEIGGRYRFVSPASREVLGYDPSELEDTDAYALLHEDDVAVMQDAHDMLVDRREDACAMRFRARHKSGAWVWLEGTARMVIDERAGQPSYAVVSSRRIPGGLESRGRVFPLLTGPGDDGEP